MQQIQPYCSPLQESVEYPSLLDLRRPTSYSISDLQASDKERNLPPASAVALEHQVLLHQILPFPIGSLRFLRKPSWIAGILNSDSCIPSLRRCVVKKLSDDTLVGMNRGASKHGKQNSKFARSHVH